jgi:hypothetical protein
LRVVEVDEPADAGFAGRGLPLPFAEGRHGRYLPWR